MGVGVRTVGRVVFGQGQMVLAGYTAEGHVRGGAATREKYHKPR